MSDLKTFAARMHSRAQVFPENMRTLVRKVAMAMDSTVIMATPVKTGRARANWIPSTGTPSDVILYPPPSAPASPGSAAQSAIDAGADTFRSYKGEGDIIYITNNLPYIERLNNGYSAQAPAGFVEKAVQAAIDSIPGAADLLISVKIEPYDGH